MRPSDAPTGTHDTDLSETLTGKFLRFRPFPAAISALQGAVPLTLFARCLTRRTHALGLLAILLALATGGCVSSTEPVLSGAGAILGEAGQLHLYDIEDGAARNPRTFRVRWTGRSYAVQGRQPDISEFTVHAFEGRDLIVQARAQRPLRPYVYALARKLADGAYLLTAIDPNDADEASRNRFCIQSRDTLCRIETPEPLFVFARASAARETEGGRLAVLVRSNQRR
jgi:hypothetical protein